MTREEFEALDATYYDACDSEELAHEAIGDAVAEALNRWAGRDCDMVALIREHSPVEVVAFVRARPRDEWVKSLASGLLESAYEQWGEEFGDPDGGADGNVTAATSKSLPEMVAAVRAFFERLEVWACEPVGSYSYSAEEVEAMMRAHDPDWFEAAPATVKAP